MKIAAFHYYALGAVLFWATSYIVTPYVLRSFTAMSVGVVRCITGGVMLAAIMISRRRPLLPAWRDMPWFFLAGMMGLSVYLYLFTQGMVTLNPTTSCIIIATTPVATALLATVIFREILSWKGWAGILLAFLGILVLSLWDGVFSVNIGIFWTQAAAILLAGYNISQRKLSQRYPAFSVAAYSYMAAAVTSLPFLPESLRQAAASPALNIWLAVYMGVFPGAIGYLLWGKALSISPNTSFAANYMFLTPFFAGLMEFLFLGQAPDPGTLVGGAIILSGLILFSIAGKPQQSQDKLGQPGGEERQP